MDPSVCDGQARASRHARITCGSARIAWADGAASRAAPAAITKRMRAFRFITSLRASREFGDTLDRDRQIERLTQMEFIPRERSCQTGGYGRKSRQTISFPRARMRTCSTAAAAVASG